MVVVYVDVLFLVNFLMNVLAVGLLSEWLSLEQPRYRVVIAAGVGALGAVLLLYLAVRFSIHNGVYLLLSGGLGVFMCRIAFPSNSWRQLLLQTLGLGITGFLVQGMCLWCNQNTILGMILTIFGELSYSILSVILVLCLLGFVLGWQQKRKKEKRHVSIYSVKLYHGERSMVLQGLWDTGNGLRDTKGRDVHVLELSCLKEFLPELWRACVGLLEGRELTDWEEQWLEAFQVQYLPYRGIQGDGMMPMITLQRMEVARGLGVWKQSESRFALTTQVLSAKGEYQCVINSG